MAALTDTEVDTILDDDRPNVPARIDGTTAVQAYTSPELARQRREAVSSLLAAGVSTDAIIAQMGKAVIVAPDGTQHTGYDLPEPQVMRLISEVRQIWDQEDAERQQWAKAAAVRRHQDHIRKASAKGAYTAVAMLETNLARIEGTNEPLEIHINDDSRVNDAVMRVLGMTDPTKLRALVAQERERYVEAEGVEVVPPKLGSAVP